MPFIFDWDLVLLAAGLDLNGYDALGDADVPVICSHDDIAWTAGAIFRPGWYRKYSFPTSRGSGTRC